MAANETFHFDVSYDNEITVAADGDKVFVSVSEEKAVDSYSSTFECTITLPLEEARVLRDWFNKHVKG